MNAVRYEVEALRDLAKRARDLASRTKTVYRRDQLRSLANHYEAKAAEIERTGNLPETAGRLGQVMSQLDLQQKIRRGTAPKPSVTSPIS